MPGTSSCPTRAVTSITQMASATSHANATSKARQQGKPAIDRHRGAERGEAPHARRQQPEAAREPCATCAQMDPALACRECIDAAHGRREGGEPAAAIAAAMHIGTDRVALLLEAHDVLAELEALTVDEVPTEGLRALIRAACHPMNTDYGVRPDAPHIEKGRMSEANLAELVAQLRAGPQQTVSAIAAALGYSHVSGLSRKVGAIPHGNVGAAKAPRYNESVVIEDAARIARALGLAPAQIDWL